MQFTTFLSKVDDSFFDRLCVVEFVCSVESELVWDQIKGLCKKRAKVTECLDIASLDLSEVSARLATTFLGSRVVFCLNGVRGALKNKQIVSLLRSYQGPHTLVYFVGESVLSNKATVGHLSIDIPEKIGIREIAKHAPILLFTPSQLEYAIVSLELYPPVLSLEQLLQVDRCIFSLPVSESKSEFLNLVRPILKKDSLFSLSDAFFSRDCESFFVQWMQQKDLFSTQFWISYFSEQCWCAYQFLLTQTRSYEVDRLYERRLPFKFIRTTLWKQWDVDQLLQIHTSLLFIDTAIKQGANRDLLDSVLQLIVVRTEMVDFD